MLFPNHSFFRSLLSLAALTATLVSARAQVTTETFKYATPDNGLGGTGWNFTGNYTPNLTSGTAGANGNASGDGWLRLTDTGGNQATSAYFNTAFTATSTTIYATFDYESYGGTGADGITFFLFDGTSTFGVGAYGGSLGYAQKTGINGLAGGYLGVALDEYGNFSAASEGRVGGLNGSSSLVPDSISVRGPGSGTSGYAYLGGTSTLAQSIDSATRPTQTNTVQILLSATNQLTVTLQQGGTNPQTVLQMDLSGYARPDTLKFGFTAGSGASTNYHDVRNLTVTTLASNRWVGGSSLWATNTNWDPTVVPTVGADILFDNSHVSSDQTIDTGADRSLRSLSFDAPFNYTLNNNTLTFDSQGVSGFSGVAVTQTHGTGVDTINSNLALNNASTIRNNAAGTLNLAGTIATNGQTLTLDGTGTNTNLTGVISGGGTLIKNDSGTDTLTGANTYSGGTTINGGTLNANNGTALGSAGVILAGGTLASNGATIANTLALTGSAGISNLTAAGALTQTGSQTLTLNNSTLGAVGLSSTGTGQTLTVQVDSGTSTIGGAITNGAASSGALIKTGAGTLVLSGSNTYDSGVATTASTTINGGSLQLGASDRLSDTGLVNIGASGTLNLGGFSEKIGNLTAAGGATLDFGTTGTANTFVFDTYTAPASGVLVINNWETGTITDKLATTVAGQTVSTIYISGQGVAQESGTKTIGLYGGTDAYLLTPIAIAAKDWDGSGSGNWNNNANWTGSPNSKPTSTELALFGATGNARRTITLNTNTTIAGIRFASGAAGGYTIQGNATARTLTLAGTVPYIQQQASFNQLLSFDTLALSNSTVVDITGSGNLTISAKITGASGSVNLIKDGNGAGKLILSGNNSGLTGSVFVNNGIVQAAHTNALGGGATTVTDGTTLELSGGISPTNAISVTGSGVISGGTGVGAIHNVSGTNTASGTITLGGDTKVAADTATTLNLTGNVTGTNRTLNLAGAGTISLNQITTGTGGVTIDSTGTVNFNGGATANTYTGVTTVNSGTLVLNKTAGTNAIAGNLAITGGTVQLSANSQIADAASVTLSGSGKLDLNGQTETLGQLSSTSSSALVTLGAGALTLSGPNNTNSNYAGTITGTGASSLNVAGTGKVYLSGNNASYAGTTNITSGTLNASGSNNVLGTGTVNISSGGNLQLQGGIGVANTASINGTGTSGNGAIENFVGNNSVTGAITVAGNSRVQSDAGTLTLGGTVTLGSNTLTFGGVGSNSVTGKITGAGGLVKDGSGDLHLGNATNDFSGPTTINAGAIIAEASNVFNNAALLTIASGASLKLNSLSETIGVLAGAGAVDFGTGGALHLTGGSATFSGSLVGSGTLYIGTGVTLTLGVNFNNSNINLVLAGGTLNLNGTAGSLTDTFGNITLQAGTASTLDFGSSIATTLNSSSIIFGDVNATLSVTNWANGVDYFNTLNQNASLTSGARGGHPEDQITFNGPVNYSNSNTAWQSYDDQLTPVPEPSTYGAFFVALCLGAVGLRRCRRRRTA